MKENNGIINDQTLPLKEAREVEFGIIFKNFTQYSPILCQN
jgi:hypothetical protein